jgi:hypothetical protein
MKTFTKAEIMEICNRTIEELEADGTPHVQLNVMKIFAMTINVELGISEVKDMGRQLHLMNDDNE